MGTSLQEATENKEFSISMPAIFCSFPLNMHPDARYLIEVADALLLDWCKRMAAACERFQLPANLFSVDHNVNSAYGFLVTLYFANAVSSQRVLPVVKLMNWIFLIDTCVDEPGLLGVDPPNATHIIDSVAAIFKPMQSSCTDDKGPSLRRPPPSQIAQELAHILTNTAAEWWSDMCVDMPLSQQARFCEVFSGYLSCIIKETPFRSACMLPDAQAYLRIRSHTVGWYPFSLLTEYTLCMDMDQEYAITSPLLIALKQSVCESVILMNDVISFRKEYERGDHFNIIMVLCSQKLQARASAALPAAVLPSTWPVELATPELLQESMNEACEMIRERGKQCECMIERIKEMETLMQMPGMGAFLEAMGNHVSGTLYWQLTSERYWPQADSICRSPDPLVVKRMAAIVMASGRTVPVKRPISAHVAH